MEIRMISNGTIKLFLMIHMKNSMAMICQTNSIQKKHLDSENL